MRRFANAADRLRPILMTACAMTVGMVPMSLALEAGSQMQAPLGRAVIGGLVCSTFATLLAVPAIFAIVIGSRKGRSPSVKPDDPESQYFDPPLDAHFPADSGEEVSPANQEADHGRARPTHWHQSRVHPRHRQGQRLSVSRTACRAENGSLDLHDS